MSFKPIIEGKSIAWDRQYRIAAEFCEPKLSLEEASKMSFTDLLVYCSENMKYNEPVEQLDMTTEILKRLLDELEKCENIDDLKALWIREKPFQRNASFKKAKDIKKKQLLEPQLFQST